MEKLNYIHIYKEFSKTSPTLLLLHGTGADEEDLIPLAEEIAPSFNILSPRGNVSENGMNRFFRRISEGIFDEEDIKFRTSELVEFIESASDKYDFDKNNVYTFGFSNGANMAASILLLKPDVLKGAVLLRPMLPIKPENEIDLKNKKVLILSGKEDSLMPKESVEKLYELLKYSNADVQIQWQEAGHGLIQMDLEDSKNYFKNF